MTEPWATGLDLHLVIDRRRVRLSLEAALRDAVSTSRLRPGAALPSSRALARDLGVARNTVVEVYGQLVAEGWLRARTGAGTVVSERVEPAAVATPEIVHTYPVLGAFDMRPGWPDLSAFPRREWLRAARRALTAASPEALNYNEPRGRPELRYALADYLARARGVRADPNQIVVCLGTMHGLAIIGKALRATGQPRGQPRATACTCTERPPPPSASPSGCFPSTPTAPTSHG
jgi:GntR family transcriptional regulator/MocR family aminotransferase